MILIQGEIISIIFLTIFGDCVCPRSVDHHSRNSFKMKKSELHHIKLHRSKRFLQNYFESRPDENSNNEMINSFEESSEKIYRRHDENICSMFIYADPFLWKQVLKLEGGNKTSTFHRIKRFLDRSIFHANRLFSLAEFYGRGRQIYKGVKFKLKDFYIDTGEDCDPRPKQTASNFYETECDEPSHLPMADLCPIKPKCKQNDHNIFCNDIRSMRFYLHAFSTRNHSQYCLAYAFTFRDMPDFQGIAWIKGHNSNDSNTLTYYGYCAESDNYCSDASTKSQNSTQIQFHQNYYRNTGVINMHLLASGIFSESTSINVFAHELGHSLGAKHDDKQSDCNPLGEDSYLMTGNSKKILLGQNLNQLSVCSNREIGFNFDSVRCWKNKVVLEVHPNRKGPKDEVCLNQSENIPTCSTDTNSTFVRIFLFTLMIVGCLLLLFLLMAAFRYVHWRRMLILGHSEPDSNTSAAHYCNRSCETEAVGSEKSRDKAGKHYCHSNGNVTSSASTVYSSEFDDAIATTFFKKFQTFKTVSNQDGGFRTQIVVLSDSEIGAIKNNFDSTLTI